MRGLIPVLALTLLLAACASAPSTTVDTDETIVGTLLLKERVNPDVRPCIGKEGYDDIQGGAQVVVTDQTGSIIATGSLAPGTPVEAGAAYLCQFAFTVSVPNDRDFYSIEVSHRGKLTYSLAEMESVGWSVEFELGG
jgi:hypothetical protein